MRPEIDQLLQKAEQSLAAARWLRDGRYLDFAASRAYYAMFYVAEALLLDRGLQFSSHSATIAAFGKEFARTGALDPKHHQHLITAQNTRNEGDYGAGPSVTPAEVEETLAWADDFIAAARHSLAGT